MYEPPITALWLERARPQVTSEEATIVAYEIVGYILGQFEQQSIGPVGRTSIALLTFLDPKDYPHDIASRIIEAYRRANVSRDEYVRGRVQSLSIQTLSRARSGRL